MRALLETERQRWTREKADEMDRSLAEYRGDTDVMMARLRDELNNSHATLDQQTHQIKALKEVHTCNSFSSA